MRRGKYGITNRMEIIMLNEEFYQNKTVLVTGHTGFKGTWMCRLLVNAGAKVIGYALQPPTTLRRCLQRLLLKHS